jgi:hypothetical protein
MYNRLQFSIKINAEKSKIWRTLWDDQMYRRWAAVFFAGSYAVTDNWKECSTVLFLAPDGSGIYSIIEKHIPNELMSFKHLGKVLDGQEQPMDEETEKWSGATEKYIVSEGENGSQLTVDIDVLDEHLEFMKEAFPRALEEIKKNCS